MFKVAFMRKIMVSNTDFRTKESFEIYKLSFYLKILGRVN